MSTSTLVLAFLCAAAPGAPADKPSAARLEKELEGYITSRHPDAIGGFIGRIAGVEEPKIAVLLPAAGTALPSRENYNAATAAIADLKTDEALKALAAVLKRKGDFRPRVLILAAFGKRNDALTLNAIGEQVRSSTPQIVVAAARAAAARRERGPIPALLDVLGERWKARDRVWYEVRAALIGLTGQDFDSIDDWRKYWSTVENSLDPRKLDDAKGVTQIARKRPLDAVEFFGAEIFSRSLIFVIDVSGSMLMYDESPTYQGSDMEKDRERLHRAKMELAAALKKLPRTAFFNIIAYSDKVLPWQKKLQPASAGNVAAALKFVADLRARGPTHTDEALDLALADLNVDTIVLLSDGAPMHNFPTPQGQLIDKILGRVADVNSSRSVTINTFGFEGTGTWPAAASGVLGRQPPPPPGPDDVKGFIEFLQRLARDNGGEFQAIK